MKSVTLGCHGGEKSRVHHAHVSNAQFRELGRLFELDLEATKVVLLTGLNRNTINHYFLASRQRIAQVCEQAALWRGMAEFDESYFGSCRLKGNCGWSAGSATIVVGILTRNGKVYTEIVPEASNHARQAILHGRVDSRSIIHSDGWRGHDGLVDVGYRKHHRVLHGANEFARGGGFTSMASKVSGARRELGW